MPLIDELRSKFAQEEYEFSKHAVDQTILRAISVQEIREAIATGEIIGTIQMINLGQVVCCLDLASRIDRYTFNVATLHARM